MKNIVCTGCDGQKYIVDEHNGDHDKCDKCDGIGSITPELNGWYRNFETAKYHAEKIAIDAKEKYLKKWLKKNLKPINKT